MVWGSGNSQALSVWEQRDSSSSDTGGCCFSLAVLGTQVCLFSEVCNTHCTLKIWNFQCLHRVTSTIEIHFLTTVQTESPRSRCQRCGFSWGLSLAYTRLPSPCVLTQPFFWMCIYKCLSVYTNFLFFPGGSDGKESACNAGDPGSIPGSGRSLGEGNGNPLQYFAWEIPWTEETGGLQSMGSQRVRHDLATKRQHNITNWIGSF